MALTIVLDVILALVLISYLGYGYRNGLVHSAGAIIGVVLGAVAAVLVVPLIGPLVPSPQLRAVAILGAAVILLGVGHAVGVAVGHGVGSQVQRTRLAPIDRVLGAVVSVVVTALVTSGVAAGIASFGVPFLTQPIASSVVLRGINTVTPDPVKSLLAQLRSVVVQDGLPRITDALGAPTTAPSIPPADTGSQRLAQAARSVVRVTGNAYACGQGQAGSGFVIAPNRILTNAHVLAGVSEPVVETPSDGAFAGSIVYFDPVDDLAVIAVGGLPTPPLAAAAGNLPDGSTAVVDGYPFGGPFLSKPAQVIARGEQLVGDIYGQNPIPRGVYTLAADVQPGNSGGPLLTPDGTVTGVVFAKGATVANVGYAMTMDEVAPVIAQAGALTGPVSSGTCTTG